MSISKGLSWGD